MAVGEIEAALWSDSASDRLRVARSLSKAELDHLHEKLCLGCPVAPWPYGNATTVNPLLVTLGASPGASPAANDPGVGALALPTAGVRHPHTHYVDRRGFWRKIRLLAWMLLEDAVATEDDAYALFGNMNLSPGRSGKTSEVAVDERFAGWVVQTIRDRLRPRLLVCLGLKNRRAGPGRDLAHLLERSFAGFRSDRPDIARGFEHGGKRYEFQEWDVTGPWGNAIKVVYWPQHPSRVPFGAFEVWERACLEFVHRHADLLRR